MKPFFVVSAVISSSKDLAGLKRFATEAEAVTHASEILTRNQHAYDFQKRFHGQFFILKAVAIVEPETPPMKYTRLEDDVKADA